MKKEKRIKIINITMMHETSGRKGGFSPVPPKPIPPSPRTPEPKPVEMDVYTDNFPAPTMLHLTSGRNGFDPLPSPTPVNRELLVDKYKGKFDRWLKNVPNGIEGDIKEYIRSQMD